MALGALAIKRRQHQLALKISENLAKIGVTMAASKMTLANVSSGNGNGSNGISRWHQWRGAKSKQKMAKYQRNKYQYRISIENNIEMNNENISEETRQYRKLAIEEKAQINMKSGNESEKRNNVVA
jgi:hypothetical protein